jgi:hypothetical protein
MMSVSGYISVEIPSGVGPYETRRRIDIEVKGQISVRVLLERLSSEENPWFAFLLHGRENPDGAHMLVLNSSLVGSEEQERTLANPGDTLYIIPPILGG